ncbi:MAG: methyltransferase domain-containing protein [Gammaproteobacteria bacterium]|nr:methyltransferase domain-containing protein [Gammaproteobacteria bacterium]
MRLTEKVHHILTNHLQEGDHAIDATAGNGYDTIFLAEQVGPSGKVTAIDIQDCAIRSTREKLESAGLIDRVKLVTGDHAISLRKLIEANRGKIAAVTFNLGYLPGSDKCIQTHAESTEEALAASIQLLTIGGYLCVTAYRGHSGGIAEAETVEAFMHKSQTDGHAVDCYEPESSDSPPILWVLKKS